MEGAGRERGSAPSPHPWPPRAVTAAVAAITALGGVLLLWSTGSDGLTVVSDSVEYARLADHLGAGEGWPGAAWPPLYPLVLAAIGRATTLDPYGAAVLVNVASYVAIVLAAFSLLRRAVGSTELVLLGTLVAAGAPATQGIVSLMSSDAPFVALTLVLLAVFPALLDERRSARVVAGVIVLLWCLSLTRWVGVLIALALALALALLPRGVPWPRRLRDAVALGVVAVLPPALWMARDVVVTGRPIQGTQGSEANLNGALRDSLSALATWMVGRAPANRLAAGAGAGVVVLAVLAVALRTERRRRRAGDGSRPGPLAPRAALRWCSAIVVLVYGGLLTIGKTATGYDLDTRTLAPLFVPLVGLGLSVADGVELRWRRGAIAVVGVWAALLVASGVIEGARLARDGAGFNSVSVHRLDAIDALRRLPEDCRLLSNQPGLLRYLGGRTVASVPYRTRYGSDVPTDELAVLAADRSTPTCIVWLEVGLTDRFQHSLADLQAALALQRVDGGEHDGATVEVFRVPAR